MKRLMILLSLLLLAALTLNGAEKKSLQYSYFVTTDFPDKIMEKLRKEADNVGGFVRYFDGKKIEMKIPGDSVEKIITLIKSSTFIQDIQIQSENYADELISLTTNLTIKKEMLGKIYEIFKTSTMIQTLDVEKEVNDYVTEIEVLTGRLKYIQNRLVLAEITVHINYENYIQTGNKIHKSLWSWINNLGLKQLLNY